MVVASTQACSCSNYIQQLQQPQICSCYNYCHCYPDTAHTFCWYPDTAHTPCTFCWYPDTAHTFCWYSDTAHTFCWYPDTAHTFCWYPDTLLRYTQIQHTYLLRVLYPDTVIIVHKYLLLPLRTNGNDIKLNYKFGKMDVEENFILCRLNGIVKMQTFVEIAEHEKKCCQKRGGKEDDNY